MTTLEPFQLTLTKETNALDGITCYEPIDAVCFDAIMKSDLLLKNLKNPMTDMYMGCERKLLSKYKALINRETNLAGVKYERCAGMSFGRSNPKRASGMFVMRSKVRHTLALKAKLSDWDIDNAHPEILLQICKANTLACSQLEYYCSNRSEILAKLMRITGCDRKRAKLLFIRLLYFGKFEGWLKKVVDKDGVVVYPDIDIYAFQNDTAFTAWITDFENEMLGIGGHIVRNNPKIVKEVKKNKEEKKKKYFNMEASVVSFYLQEYECRILEQIYIYCCEQNYIKENVCVLCADGIMLENDLIADADIPTEFHTIVLEKTGFNLNFSNKELDNGWTDEFLETHKINISALDDTKFKRFDTNYFNSLVGYTRKKIYFEVFVSKVLRPDPVYVYIEEESDIGEDLCFYSQSKITDTFNHLKSGVFCDNGEEKKFMTEWLGDENIKLNNKMDFLPFNDKDPISSHIFNLFRGFNDKRKTEYDYSKRGRYLKPFLDLGKELCGGDEEHLDYLLKYIADIIQNPQKKNPIAFIIKGKQGTGKNVWLNAIGNLLGLQHYISSSNPKDFFGDYAEGFYHKLLVNMNECEGKDTFDFEGRIKSFITEDKITLNRKFVQPITIMNLARLIIFTNKPNPIPIDIRSKDRRYVVYDTTDVYLSAKYGTNFWKALVGHFNSPEFIACLYDYLNDMDIENFDWRTKRPITKAYLQMCKLYVPAEILFLENKMNTLLNSDAGRDALTGIAYADMEGVDVEEQEIEEEDGYLNNERQLLQNGILGQELYKEYVAYCKEWGFFKEASYQKTLTAFYSKLADFELPIIQKKEHNTIRYYFSMKEVMDFMKMKKWIDRSDEDYNVETEAEVEGDDFTEYFTI
tara:strand:+ start:58 stop:2649 length:2592 start_codon:yes stop_codon:yes gene_type:complete